MEGILGRAEGSQGGGGEEDEEEVDKDAGEGGMGSRD